MTGPRLEIALPFPSPPRDVADAFDDLRRLASTESLGYSERVLAASAPRPWDPPTCDAGLRQQIYEWLAEVVGWINEEHVWRTDQAIPPCWLDHPHIAHEIAVVAALRWEAALATVPGPMEDWHRYVLPQFLERIVVRVGENGCPPGRHQPHPGITRNAAYRADGDCHRLRARHDAAAANRSA
jgi:hypothetical protein